MGGTPKRMENFAHYIMDEIGYKLPAGTQLQDISAFSYRYSMYKVRIIAFLFNLPLLCWLRMGWSTKRERVNVIWNLGWAGVIDKSWYGRSIGRHPIARNDQIDVSRQMQRPDFHPYRHMWWCWCGRWNCCYHRRSCRRFTTQYIRIGNWHVHSFIDLITSNRF